MDIHILFAKISWILLIIILFVRPLADIFRWKFLFKILRFRKKLGIICGISAILHVIVYLYGINSLSSYFSNSIFWKLDNFLGWGSLALIMMLFPLLTSNIFSQRFFKRKWKSVQRVTYLTFIFTGIHIFLIAGNWFYSLLPVLLWLILWIWAWKIKR
ncbi:MAG: ferric reductase-like transmembrane domain-containing protein [Candidatus Moranbacteria bacterium]|nr:ferric reductase-like transmembrane domain-containing protein [Candidatus Moranbacteria bacterium]